MAIARQCNTAGIIRSPFFRSLHDAQNTRDRRRLSALVASATAILLAQERVDPDINAKIRKEGQDNSKILRTLHYLTDVYGPRLTGSPNLKAAGEWAIKEMASWGFVNGRLEPWDFGRPGWTNELAVGAIVSPVKDKLEFEVLAWTPGTDGTVKAKAFNLILPDQPTKDELEDVPRERQGAGQGRHRPRRPIAAGAGQPRAAGEAHARRSGARPLQRAARRAAAATDAAGAAAASAGAARRRDAGRRASTRASTSSCSRTRSSCGSTTPRASTGRSARSRTTPTTSPRSCRRS